MGLWLDSEQQHAACPLSLNYHHPWVPISFAYFSLLQNVFVLRLGRVHAHTHNYQSPAHCWHHLPSSFNAALAISNRERIKAKTETVCEVRKGVTKTRDPICSHSLTSQCRSWTPSLLCFGSLRMTSRGALVENMWERVKSRKKAFFIFKRWHWLFYLFQLSSVFHFLLVRSWLCREQKKNPKQQRLTLIVSHF